MINDELLVWEMFVVGDVDPETGINKSKSVIVKMPKESDINDAHDVCAHS
jgi:hypothetical protein